jgi:cytochrome c biogenesis protein CcdA
MTAGAERLIQASLTGGSLLALPLALLGGFVVSLNPCCLPLYPAAAATCCLASECDARPRLAFTSALAFVFGTVAAMTALGVGAAALGQTMTAVGGDGVRYAVALVPLVMGLHALGWIHLAVPRSPKMVTTGSLSIAFLTGLLLSLVLAPCGMPVLAAILSYATYQGKIWYGGLLMFVYGLGAGVPMLLIGVGAGRLTQHLAAAAWRPRIDQIAGAVLLGLGFYLLWSA